MIITGDYVIISEETEGEDWNLEEIKGTIYEMKKIHSYKLIKK